MNVRYIQHSSIGSSIWLCFSWWPPVLPGCYRLICCLRAARWCMAALCGRKRHLLSMPLKLAICHSWRHLWISLKNGEPHTAPTALIDPGFSSSQPTPASLFKYEPTFCMNCLHFYVFHSYCTWAVLVIFEYSGREYNLREVNLVGGGGDKNTLMVCLGGN